MKYCAICGDPWEDCGGECQSWIKKEEKVEWLREMERRKKERCQDMSMNVLNVERRKS